MTEPIRNRIVESGTADPTELVENPKNWRVHPEFQREALETVLDTVGWVQDVIVNRTTGLIVDGHLRVAVAVAREEKSIPVKWVELSEAEEATVLATIDPLASFAESDDAALTSLLESISATDDLATLLESLMPVPPATMKDRDEAHQNQLEWLYTIEITCVDEAQQIELSERFAAEGLDHQCRMI